MKSIHFIFCVATVFILVSCTTSQEKVSNQYDYEQYLIVENNIPLKNAQNEKLFWETKLKNNPSQYPYLSKIAGYEAALFEATGSIEHLVAAGQILEELNKKTKYSNASYLRGLARNYISQHRFKEALDLLKKGETNGEKLLNTKKMLFDVSLELGNYDEAKQYLFEFRNVKDFDYLIRISKWSDYKGNLKNAISYMEMATRIAEADKNEALMQWSYTNLADFYGHNNQIKDSYEHYLKALAINPNDAYAKKGIAWILYSHEHKPKEALRILDSIIKNYHSPDYYLLKAEIEEFIDNDKAKKENIEKFIAVTSDQRYGAMYNKYIIGLYVEDLKMHEKAFTISKQEIEARPTPQSYDLLAWTYFNANQPKKALEIVQQNIVGKTFEPEVQYHMAEIYKANGMAKLTMKLKEELLESSYELGPLMERKIQQL